MIAGYPLLITHYRSHLYSHSLKDSRAISRGPSDFQVNVTKFCGITIFFLESKREQNGSMKFTCDLSSGNLKNVVRFGAIDPQ